jgi:hypothetical protein
MNNDTKKEPVAGDDIGDDIGDDEGEDVKTVRSGEKK